MSNSHLKDRSISLKAKGLLSLILSLPDGWVYTIKGLATLSSDGLDSTRAALKNLEDHGYVVRRQLYDKRGRFAKCEYTVYERPQRSSPPTGSPSTCMRNKSRSNAVCTADTGQSVTVECVNGKAHAIKYE